MIFRIEVDFGVLNGLRGSSFGAGFFLFSVVNVVVKGLQACFAGWLSPKETNLSEAKA